MEKITGSWQLKKKSKSCEDSTLCLPLPMTFGGSQMFVCDEDGVRPAASPAVIKQIHTRLIVHTVADVTATITMHISQAAR